MKILYYPDGDKGPVRDYLVSLANDRPKAFAKLALDFELLGAEGLRSGQISVRLLDDGLWELRRLYEGIQYRVFFCVRKGVVYLLHCIEKKSAKTPSKDLKLAHNRLRRIMI